VRNQSSFVLKAVSDILVVFVTDPPPDDVKAHGRKEEGGRAVEEEGAGANHAEDQVKPEHQVDFLVDDVLREDAEAVVPLLAAAGAHGGHVARDLLRKGRAERINGASTLCFVHRIIINDL